MALSGACPAWVRAGTGSEASGDSAEIGARDGAAAGVCAVGAAWRRGACGACGAGADRGDCGVMVLTDATGMKTPIGCSMGSEHEAHGSGDWIAGCPGHALHTFHTRPEGSTCAPVVAVVAVIAMVVTAPLPGLESVRRVCRGWRLFTNENTLSIPSTPRRRLAGGGRARSHCAATASCVALSRCFAVLVGGVDLRRR